MKQHEIELKFTETEDDSISEACKCEFCDRSIRFYRHKHWITDSYQVQNADGSFHVCNRPLSWSDEGVPDGWVYWKSDDDDDRACFIQKKYTRFEK